LKSSSEDNAMLSTLIGYIAAALFAALIGFRAVLALVYRPGRQVEFRIGAGAGTGEILGFSGLRMRVRSLHSGHEHTISVTRVKRR
jgi:hypothetical protein